MLRSSPLDRTVVRTIVRAALLAGCLTSIACEAHDPGRPQAGAQPAERTAAAASSAAPVSGPPASASAGASTAAAPLAPRPVYPPPAPPDPPIKLRTGGKKAVRGELGVVTSVEPNATRVGADVLRAGGNAIDAAVAIAYVLAVTHPNAGNIGGGGFMLVRLASGESYSIDFRETAPASFTTEKLMSMLKDDGAIGYRSAGVPGSVAGLNLARDRFGTKPLPELMAPAIELARKGHRLGPRQALVLSWQWPKLKTDAAARAVFGEPSGKEPIKEGHTIRQVDLAKTLEVIARDGSRAFYEGPIAQAIDKAMKAHGGHITAEDLKAYRAKERLPLHFSYRGFDVATTPLPSMGGIAFAEIMLTLERLRAHEAPPGSALALHLFIEAARRGYADRRLIGGDPDFMAPDATSQTLVRLLGGAHLEARKPIIDRERATPSADLGASIEAPSQESPETTHFSVVDAAGNAVSCTTTQSASFGSKIIIPGTGLLLGNALGGFSEKGVNAVAPGKRMASSMSPTVVTQGGKLALVLGSPGGDTIPNTVAQVFRNVVDWGMTIDQAVAAGRMHHQYLPDRVRVEKTKAPAKPILDELTRRGHTLDLEPMVIGDANNILVDVTTGVAFGYSDTREGGKAEGVSALKKQEARR
jgi:gamma-glutamyltranspeptidase/glutathione hydrolase